MIRNITLAMLIAFSTTASALDIGAGLGTCVGGLDDDPANYCEAGITAKFFVRHIHMMNDHVGWEGEFYHFSHPETEDFHRSKWHERTGDNNGISVNVFYRF